MDDDAGVEALPAAAVVSAEEARMEEKAATMAGGKSERERRCKAMQAYCPSFTTR